MPSEPSPTFRRVAQVQLRRPISGHVYRRKGRRGDVWYVKWRDTDGQHQKALGRAWTEKGSPPAGYLREREAKEALEALLTDARRGALRRMKVRVTFADVAAEWLRHGEHERGWKRSTVVDYRSAMKAHLLPAFGQKPLDAISARSIEAWRSEWLEEHKKPRQAAKLVSIVHAVFERAKRTQGLTENPVGAVERLAVQYDRTAYDFYSPEDVAALVRAATSEQDAALFLVAAFAGLRRGELLALRWRDVDFERQAIRVQGNYSHGDVVAPKSGHGRAVPMVPQVAQPLARLSQRPCSSGREDWCSAARRVSTSMPPRSDVASRRRCPAPASLSSGSTTSANLRVARHQQGFHRSGAGLDGTCGCRHDDALPAPQIPRRRGGATG